MATEYFWPHDLGGSEWSTYYLARQLINEGHEVIIITPNYGSKNREVWRKISIFRFPFYQKIKGGTAISPFWHTNILWIILSTFYLIKICKAEKIDALHIQGKYYSPAGYITKLILRIPAILTVRDYQLICNYGFCIWNNKKSCNLKEYFTQDLKQYLENYVPNKTMFSLISNLAFALRARIIRNIFKYFALKMTRIICISKAQTKIYKGNGFKKVNVIYNSMEFNLRKKTKVENKIVFAGRLTPGKGINLLMQSMPEVLQKFPKLQIQIIGEGILKKSLEKLAKKNPNVKLEGQISHTKLLNTFSKYLVTVMPSIWPEPFGRIALESISQGTPVVVTRNGGLSEIVDHGKTGYVCPQTTSALAMSIIMAIKNNKELRNNIRSGAGLLKKKFHQSPAQKYIKIYENTV